MILRFLKKLEINLIIKKIFNQKVSYERQILKDNYNFIELV